jgi:predicted porin
MKMKKSIIALAVVGAMTAPIIAQADATLYGRIHERVVFAEDKDMSIESAGSRLGVKGSSEMDSGLTAFYNIEMSFGEESGRDSDGSTDDSTSLSFRQMHAGVRGDFGEMKIGRFTNPFVATYTHDIFEHNSGVFEQTAFRIGDAISYTTPKFGGLDATLAIIGEGEGDDATFEDVDAVVARIGGTFGAITAQVAYMDSEYTQAAGGDKEHTSVGLAYDANNLYLGLNFETEDAAGTDTDVVEFAARYTVGKTNFGFAHGSEDISGGEDTERTMVGVYQNLGGSADAYVELASFDKKIADDSNRVTIGYRVQF